MATLDYSKYFLYRWRYVLSYIMVGLLLAALLLFSGLYLPGALSSAEMKAVVISESLSFTDPASLAVLHLPYFLAQSGIFTIFGVTIFSTKLLSLILALVSAVGIIILLRRWFKPNIAVLASLIAITTGQFLFIAQSGYPSILYIFWPTMLLLLGTQVTRAKRGRFLWKILFAITAALSLYSPLSVYPLIAIFLAIALHPHLRAAVRRLSKARLTSVTILFLVLVAPLGYLIFLTPRLGLTLLGVPTDWPPDISANALQLLKQYFLFWEPSITAVMTPVFGLGSALLIILGTYRLIRTRETTRSYLVIIWIVCLTPVLLLNPDFTSVTFIPSILLLAAGITSLIGYWYRLFPLNPYARIVGLVPIVILVGVLIISGVTRYAYGYHYTPSVAGLFSKDLSLIPKDTKQLVVGDEEKAFYTAVARFNETFTVVDIPTEPIFVATKAATPTFNNYKINQIITDPHSQDADRLYVYQNQ